MEQLVNFPDFPELKPEQLETVARQYGAKTWTQLPQIGICNRVFLLGQDLILRVPRQVPNFIAALKRESIALPMAKTAGVSVPDLIAFDDSQKILDVPFMVQTRIHGRTLGLLSLEPESTPQTWQQLGQDLARLHTGIAVTNENKAMIEPPMTDPRALANDLAEQGWITTSEATWLHSQLEPLASALENIPARFRHGDLQTTNIMVQHNSLKYTALIDWGAATWGDPAFDFAGIPLRAVPWLMHGYAEITPIEASFKKRVLWRHWQLALFLASRSPQPKYSWAERPLAMLFEIMRFSISRTGQAWLL